MTRKKTNKKREAPISYRPPAALREEFADRVARSGLSRSAFITKAIFSQELPRQSRRPIADEKEIGRLLIRLSRLTDFLATQEVALADDAEIKELITAIYNEIAEMRAALFKALGRQP